MMLHVGPNSVWWSNYVSELVREFSMHYPSWYDIKDAKKAHIRGRLMHHFDLKTHMSGPRWTDIEKGIEKFLAKRYFDNKHNLNRDYWNVLDRDVEAIRSRPPPNVEQSEWDAQIKFWVDQKNAARAAAANAHVKAQKRELEELRSVIKC
ncbi:hypothetical protein Tco_1548872 [Tanacetum coccineum]